ncbi:phage virion morphogenesis protein [Proteus vulgaris]|uniref:phage virion morphogenesis protein n=1 Tax=Proteus vulgaris TaxID=585 RepID=UPI00214C90B3|nr:phage virion morphogenesis protein [Proteus vulgaris]
MLAKASPNERKKLAREIARDLRKSNLQRIRAQKNPDGTRIHQTKSLNGYRITGYENLSGKGNRAVLKNWRLRKTKKGEVITGYDLEREPNVVFISAIFCAYIEVKKDKISTSKPNKQTRMFKRLATARYLRMSANDKGVTLSFAPSSCGQCCGASLRFERACAGQVIRNSIP